MDPNGEMPRSATVRNLFASLPAPAAEESFEPVAAGAGVRIERIVSYGHRSPADFWYDQEEDEWVAVLEGRAGIRFADAADAITLERGDSLVIPARTRHRVEWTEAPTIWLAVRYRRA